MAFAISCHALLVAIVEDSTFTVTFPVPCYGWKYLGFPSLRHPRRCK